MNQNVLPLGIVFSLLLTLPTPEIAQAVSIEMFPSKQAVAVGEAFQVDIVINGLGKIDKFLRNLRSCVLSEELKPITQRRFLSFLTILH